MLPDPPLDGQDLLVPIVSPSESTATTIGAALAAPTGWRWRLGEVAL